MVLHDFIMFHDNQWSSFRLVSTSTTELIPLQAGQETTHPILLLGKIQDKWVSEGIDNANGPVREIHFCTITGLDYPAILTKWVTLAFAKRPTSPEE